MLTSILGSFCGANDPLNAAISSTIAMGIAGENAGNYVKQENSGTGTFKSKLIDYLYILDEEEILNKGKLYEINLSKK
jgi:hydroxyethylthiazole kinase